MHTKTIGEYDQSKPTVTAHLDEETLLSIIQETYKADEVTLKVSDEGVVTVVVKRNVEGLTNVSKNLLDYMCLDLS